MQADGFGAVSLAALGQATWLAMSADDSLSSRLEAAETAYRSGQHRVAFDLYSDLGSQGHVESQLMAAWMTLNGLGVTRDTEAAMHWFEKAAALGSAQGSFHLARYLTSLGRHQEARRYYATAAHAEHLPSIFWMGHSAARGKGTQVDQAEAYKYLTRAAKRGHVYAIRELGVLDMSGGRGVMARPLGVVEFIAAGVAAFVLAIVNKESDLLRA